MLRTNLRQSCPRSPFKRETRSQSAQKTIRIPPTTRGLRTPFLLAPSITIATTSPANATGSNPTPLSEIPNLTTSRTSIRNAASTRSWYAQVTMRARRLRRWVTIAAGLCERRRRGPPMRMRRKLGRGMRTTSRKQVVCREDGDQWRVTGWGSGTREFVVLHGPKATGADLVVAHAGKHLVVVVLVSRRRRKSSCLADRHRRRVVRLELFALAHRRQSSEQRKGSQRRPY